MTLKILSHTYSIIVEGVTLKFFLYTILLLKVDCSEGLSNWNKINGMVNNYLSSCNS